MSRRPSRELRGDWGHVEVVEADRDTGRGWDQAAPWQEGQTPHESWIFPLPPGMGDGVESFTLPRHGRPQYVGPRDMRDVWQQVDAGVFSHAVEGGDLAPLRTGVAGDALVTYLIEWRVERDRERRMNPQDPRGRRTFWPKPSALRRLFERRAEAAQRAHLMEAALWRPGLPEVPVSGGLRHLPRWWLWRKTWPGLHALQRVDPLPVYLGGSRTDRLFIPVHVERVSSGVGKLFPLLRAAGYSYRGAGDDGRGLREDTATITKIPTDPTSPWRVTLDARTMGDDDAAWSRDWRKMP